MKRSGKRAKRLACWALLAVALWLLASLGVAYRLTRRPTARFDEPAPAVAWGKARAFRLPTADGEELGAWFFEGSPGRPVVVLLHGYGSCRSSFLAQAEMVAAEGCGALLVSLRAHGDSSGAFNDFGLGARHDVIAGVRWLEEKQSGRPIVVWGQSLGSAAALFAAAELGERVSGYVLESPYRDLRTAVWNRTRYYLPPGLDLAAYTGLLVVSPLVIPQVDRIAPLQAAAGIPKSVAVLVLAGDADRRARPDEARELAKQIGAGARLVLIAGGDHGRLLAADPPVYRTAVSQFIAGLSSQRRGRAAGVSH